MIQIGVHVAELGDERNVRVVGGGLNSNRRTDLITKVRENFDGGFAVDRSRLLRARTMNCMVSAQGSSRRLDGKDETASSGLRFQ